MSASGPFKTIVLVSSSLNGGGAERILITMAENWIAQGHSVSILTLRTDVAVEYELPEGARRIRLDLIGETNPFWRPNHIFRLWRLRHAIVRSRPDLVISYLDKMNIAVLLSLIGTEIPVVATEHLAPWKSPIGPGWEMLRKLIYRRARFVVSPTEAITNWFIRRMSGTFVTLPSPVGFKYKLGDIARHSVILGVGRLAPQKGFDLLIEAFGRLAPSFPDWKLEIAGVGPEQERLTEIVKRLNLKGRVCFLGYIEDIQTLYKSCEIFVLSSRHEAYPMALCEALLSGCCVIATDCDTGPREIVRSPDMLVPPENVDALAEKLGLLLSSPQHRKYNRGIARDAAKTLESDSVFQRWNEVLGIDN